MTTNLGDGRDCAASVTQLMFDLPPAKADELLPVLDGCARFMREVQT
jgi:hypothetical protein